MKRFYPFFFTIILALLLTACGSSTTSGSGTNSGYTSPTPTAAANTGSTPTAATTDATLSTASATVNGKTVTLLTNAKGMTLYYFQPDTATTSACTGGCASIWPPLLSNNVPATSGLSGTLTLQKNTNGQQVTYNGHPLYTYSGDSSPGQTTGEGLSNKWFVATNDLATNSGSGGSTPTSGGGYGSSSY